jgi:hypothetical protein
MEIMQQLRVWFMKHIHDADQKFVQHLKTINVEAILAGWKAPVQSPQISSTIESRVELGVW